MKTSLLFVSLILLVLALPLLAAQQAGAPAGQGQNPPKPSDPPAVLTFEGELSNVNMTAKTITVRSTAPAGEMVFSYDDQTEVVGIGDGVQSLTGKIGSMLRVSYRGQRGTNHATKIEVQPKKA